MKNQTVSTKLMSLKQRDDIIATMIGFIPDEMTFDDAQGIIGAKGEFGKGVRKAFESFVKTKTVRYHLSEQERFYEEVFGLECDFSKVRVPVSREGFDRLIVLDERISTQMTFEKCQERFGAWKYTDLSLDEAVPTNDRDQLNGTYAIWLRETVKADEVHKDKSANDLKASGIKGMTLRERLLLELFYEWKNSDQHLDLVNWTLCAGSRGSGGGGPGVGWDDGRLEVHWVSPGVRGDGLRSREAVS